ncbi:MAG: 3'(2'),5'-bisphosphate nucleotidase CysQ [Rikenellaceae bacterium]
MEREFIDFLIVSGANAAIKAGKEIMKLYNSSEEFDASLNSNNTIVTKADRIAHETIKNQLTTTRIPIMSEEGRNILYEERYSWDLYWLVDPLDGTREFIHRNDEFVISISLMNNKNPYFGVIYVPTEDKLYFSDPDRGAFVVEECEKKGELFTTSTLFGSALRLRGRNETRESGIIKIAVTRSHLNSDTIQIIEHIKEQYKDKEVEVINCGSSKKFCLLAEGNVDIYFRTTPLFDWDIAAGEAIAKAVGANIITFNGTPTEYNKEQLIIDPFYVSTIEGFTL